MTFCRGVAFGVSFQLTQMREQIVIDEAEKATRHSFRQLKAFRALRISPVLPPIRMRKRGREHFRYCLRLLGLRAFALAENAQKQNPRQLRYVLQRPSAVRAPHDVADGFHRRVDGLRRR